MGSKLPQQLVLMSSQRRLSTDEPLLDESVNTQYVAVRNQMMRINSDTAMVQARIAVSTIRRTLIKSLNEILYSL
jgi:hypothetical protein